MSNNMSKKYMLKKLEDVTDGTEFVYRSTKYIKKRNPYSTSNAILRNGEQEIEIKLKSGIIVWVKK